MGFREFNNRYGQELGDAVLAEVAAALRTLRGTSVIRDGGDELLIVGAPGSALEPALDAFEAAWPERFAARFGSDAPPVRARIVVGALRRGALLREARERLGREVGTLKLRGESRMRVTL